jgi:hypothetical protein
MPRAYARFSVAVPLRWARVLQSVAAALALLSGQAAVAEYRVLFTEPCQRPAGRPLPAVSGPYDYRTEKKGLGIVDGRHFTTRVENLVGVESRVLSSEFSFTLHGYPNHHRALAALIRWAEREKSDQPGNLDYSVDCYFRRALVFRSDDYIVRLLYADYLIRRGRTAEAGQHMDHVLATHPDSPLTHYTLGLLYLRSERFDEALKQAHKAIEMGVPHTELRKKLQDLGRWREQPEVPDPPPANAQSTAPLPGATGDAAASAPQAKR